MSRLVSYLEGAIQRGEEDAAYYLRKAHEYKKRPFFKEKGWDQEAWENHNKTLGKVEDLKKRLVEVRARG